MNYHLKMFHHAYLPSHHFAYLTVDLKLILIKCTALHVMKFHLLQNFKPRRLFFFSYLAWLDHFRGFFFFTKVCFYHFQLVFIKCYFCRIRSKLLSKTIKYGLCCPLQLYLLQPRPSSLVLTFSKLGLAQACGPLLFAAFPTRSWLISSLSQLSTQMSSPSGACTTPGPCHFHPLLLVFLNGT